MNRTIILSKQQMIQMTQDATCLSAVTDGQQEISDNTTTEVRIDLDEESDESALVGDEKQLELRLCSDRAAFAKFLETSDTVQLRTVEDIDDEHVSTKSRRIIERARDYQQELFEQAKNKNLIAVLDTGSGKTLIACLLVRHTLAQELVRRSQSVPPRVVIFMANSVHLVRQQANVLANNLTATPAVVCGNDRAETWRTKQFWEAVIERNTPVACTPAILQQCLDSSILSIDQISLLIFDEAHHAKKNHPYSRIMRSHYFHCPRGLKPRIFGMTASPIDSKGDVHSSAADLEQLLDSRISTTSDMSILSFAPKPRDVTWTYCKPPEPTRTDFYSRLSPCRRHLQELDRAFVFADYALAELGTWCADQAWKYIFGISEGKTATLIKRYEQSDAYINLESVQERESELRKLEQAHDLVSQLVLQPSDPDETNLHPKVLRLKHELSVRYKADPNLRGIVFVDRRLAALTLHDCFRKLDIENLRPGVLLGSSSEDIIPREHREALTHFRAGIVNLIFATSVADEGIDIPQCNLCVRFDLYKSPIQYMQSRGRARMEDSIYVHMIEEGNISQENAVRYVIDSDVYIKEFCQSLPPDRLLGRGTQLQRLLAQDSGTKCFKTSLGAICDFGNCLQILSNFATTLRHMGAGEREMYEEHIMEEASQFRYIVRLPLSSETRVRGARGELRFTKQLAKRSAAFNCCILLRRRGLLDDQLRSVYRKAKPINHNARLAVSEEETSHTILIKPMIWSRTIGIEPTGLFHAVITFGSKTKLCHPLASIVLLTRHRMPDLPSFDVFIEDNIRTRVSFWQPHRKVPVSADELKLLTNFTLDGIFVDVFNKQYFDDPMKVSYWLAPVNPTSSLHSLILEDIIDLQSMQQVRLGRIKWSSESNISKDWTNKFICDPRNGDFRYFSKNVAKNFKAHDPVPESVPGIAQKSRNSIIDFSDSSWKASKKYVAAATWDPGQPILHADFLPAKRNFLDLSSRTSGVSLPCYIAPQPLEVSRLDPGFAASCFVWPTIIHKVEAYFIAWEGVEQTGLRGIPAELALEAFTKNSATDDSENRNRSSEEPGTGKNYERLEFLGDSLLKMMTTITVFLRTNCDEEGMHCRRMQMICNQNLFKVSTEKYELSKYIRMSGFSRRNWYPEHLILLKGRGAKAIPQEVKHPDIKHSLSMKTIADVSEALIGAAVMANQYLPGRFDLGIEAISLLIDSPDHTIRSWSELSMMYETPSWSLATNDVVANHLAIKITEKTGYTFKRPRLVRSAFTHSSDTSSTVPDLQRLEFLGDALLDWVSVSWLFHTNPGRDPQWLTEHKMAMVSNKFLAALAVSLDFDKFIQTGSVAILSDISKYAGRVRARMAQPDVLPEFWTEIESPPKSLSDLIESYLGAVLLDSDFDYNEIEKFFNQHILSFFKDITRYDGFANRHPTSYLHTTLRSEYKCQDYCVLSTESNLRQTESSITAGVLIHGRVAAHASAGGARAAKVEASKNALEIIKGMTRADFVTKFGCNCQSNDDTAAD